MHLLLLMPDHLHCLVSFPKTSEMRRIVASWKGITAKNSRIQWQRDFFDHRLRGSESTSLKIRYISENPVRAGLVSKAEDWPFVWDRFD